MSSRANSPTKSRPSYSVYRIRSARHAAYVTLSDRLHQLLLIRADTEPGVADYALYTPAFTYLGKHGEKTATFVITARFTDGRVELWSSTWTPIPDLSAPLHRAQRAHAEHLGAAHRLFTARELVHDDKAAKNRATMQAYLAALTEIDTQAAEHQILERLDHSDCVTLGALAQALQTPLELVKLAGFRLLVRGLVTADLEHSLIRPDWPLRRRDSHAQP